MTYDAIIMAGHQHIEQNQDVTLRDKTGAPGEQVFTISLAELAVNRLMADGYEAVAVDANFHPEIYREDAGVFAALHYDSHGPDKPRGCRMCRPEFDHAAAASDRLVQILLGEYPERTGIPLYRDNQLTVGMTRNYAFSYPTLPTPCAIIECGVGHHPLDRPLLCHEDGTARVEIAHVLAINIAAFLDGPAEPVDAHGPSDYAKMLNRQRAVERLLQLKRAESDTVAGEWRAIELAYHRVIDGETDLLEW